MIEIKKNGKKVRANDKFTAKSIKLITEIDLGVAAIHGYLMLIAVIETGELILYFTENKNKIGKKFDIWEVYDEYEEIEYIDSIVNSNNNNHSYILLDCKSTHSSIATNIASKMRIALKDIFFKTNYFSNFHALFFNAVMNYQIAEIETVDKAPKPVNQSQKIKSSANNIVASDSLKFEITVNIRQIS